VTLADLVLIPLSSGPDLDARGQDVTLKVKLEKQAIPVGDVAYKT
jgi:hypothetical protein